MQYKQPLRILAEIARDERASAKVQLTVIDILSGDLPRLGRYAPGSTNNLLWRLASNGRKRPLPRLKALQRLISKPKEDNMMDRARNLDNLADEGDALLRELFELSPDEYVSHTVKRDFCKRHAITEEHEVFAEYSALMWDAEAESTLESPIESCTRRFERLIEMYRRGGFWRRQKALDALLEITQSSYPEHKEVTRKIEEFLNSLVLPDEK